MRCASGERQKASTEPDPSMAGGLNSANQ